MICVIRGFHTKFNINDTFKHTLFFVNATHWHLCKSRRRNAPMCTITRKFMSFSIWKIIIESNVSYRWCLRNCAPQSRISSYTLLFAVWLPILDSPYFFLSPLFQMSVRNHILFKSPSMRSLRSGANYIRHSMELKFTSFCIFLFFVPFHHLSFGVFVLRFECQWKIIEIE